MKKQISKNSFWHKAIITSTLTCLIGWVNAQSSSQWTLLTNDKGVSVEYQLAQCNGKDFLFYNIQNSTNQPATVMCTINVKDAGGNVLLSLPPQPFTLGPNGTTRGSCAEITSEYVKPLPPSSGYQIELVNSKVF